MSYEPDDTHDSLVPDGRVWREFGVTRVTLTNWTNDPALGFPPSIKINGRNFRSRRALEQFKQGLLGKAIAEIAA